MKRNEKTSSIIIIIIGNAYSISVMIFMNLSRLNSREGRAEVFCAEAAYNIKNLDERVVEIARGDSGGPVLVLRHGTYYMAGVSSSASPEDSTEWPRVQYFADMTKKCDIHNEGVMKMLAGASFVCPHEV